MRRTAVHLVAAIAETLRFLAIVFLAFDVGALDEPGVSALLRYAAAPQLLFAAGFFFMWLDRPRYGEYRPLLLVGKAACAACLVPLAWAIARDPWGSLPAFGLRNAGILLSFLVAAVDVFSLTVLILSPGTLRREPGEGGGQARDVAQDPPADSQGPAGIEKVEG
jgi:hypothetical protein